MIVFHWFLDKFTSGGSLRGVMANELENDLEVKRVQTPIALLRSISNTFGKGMKPFT